MEEVEGMKKAVNGEKPMTLILGGAKEDKMKYLNELSQKMDHILIGGKLPKLVDRSSMLDRSNKILIAKLRDDGLDLSDEDINQFVEVINSSNTIIWSGAMGFYEDPNCQKGTQKIAMAVAESGASFKTIAGGDTSASIKDLGLKDKIDFICSGGGVLLEMLIKGDLPAWN
jgi:phosphoglycerate kinase